MPCVKYKEALMQIDWQRYWDLEKKNWKDLTDEEKEFCKYMYHVEF